MLPGIPVAAAAPTPAAPPLRQPHTQVRTLCSGNCQSSKDLQVLCLNFVVHHFLCHLADNRKKMFKKCLIFFRFCGYSKNKISKAVKILEKY